MRRDRDISFAAIALRQIRMNLAAYIFTMGRDRDRETETDQDDPYS